MRALTTEATPAHMSLAKGDTVIMSGPLAPVATVEKVMDGTVLVCWQDRRDYGQVPLSQVLRKVDPKEGLVLRSKKTRWN